MTGPIFSWTITSELVGNQPLTGCEICGQGTATRWRDRPVHARCVPDLVEQLAPEGGWWATSPAPLSAVEVITEVEDVATRLPELVRQYIESGGEVLPLHWRTDEGRCSCGSDCGQNAAKHPLTRNGLLDATTERTTVEMWASRWPRCNWGLRPPEGVKILDIDPRNGGDDTLRELQRIHAALSLTLTARTGGGGEHRWFTHHGPSRGKLGPGVDVKHRTGYVVVPPSVHISGAAYEWLDRRPTAVAPAWLRALLDPTPPRTHNGPVSGNVANLVRFVEAAQEGERNRSTFWAMCRAVEGGHDLAPIIDAAIGIGLTAHEVHAAARSAQRRGAAA